MSLLFLYTDTNIRVCIFLWLSRFFFSYLFYLFIWLYQFYLCDCIREAWQAAACGVPNCWTQLSNWMELTRCMKPGHGVVGPRPLGSTDDGCGQWREKGMGGEWENVLAPPGPAPAPFPDLKEERSFPRGSDTPWGRIQGRGGCFDRMRGSLP